MSLLLNYMHLFSVIDALAMNFLFFSLLVSDCFAQCRSANALTASLVRLTPCLRDYVFNIVASKTSFRFSRFDLNFWCC